MTDKTANYISAFIIIMSTMVLIFIIDKQHREIVYYESYYQEVVNRDSIMNREYDSIIIELDRMNVVFDSIIEKQVNK